MQHTTQTQAAMQAQCATSAAQQAYEVSMQLEALASAALACETNEMQQAQFVQVQAALLHKLHAAYKELQVRVAMCAMCAGAL